MREAADCESLSDAGLNPSVLISHLYTQGMTMPKGHLLPKRFIYDYELEFFTQSDGAMYIDEKLYPVHKGDIVFRRPGQTTQGIMPYCCYLIGFDMTGTADRLRENYNFWGAQAGGFQKNYRHPVLDPIPVLFHPIAGDKYLGLFDLVLKEFINPSAASSVLLKAYTLQILCLLSRDVRDPLNNRAVLQSGHGMAIKRAVDYIAVNLGAPLRLETLAKLAGLSPTYFHKIFSETMGVTPNDFLTGLRLERAKELLARTNLPVYKVAMECGFENIPYFSSLFKKHQGIAPAEFRRRHSYV